MQRRHQDLAGARSICFALAALCALALTPCAAAHAQGRISDTVAPSPLAIQVVDQDKASDYQPVFHLNYRPGAATQDCQVPLPPVGAVSPFPVALRLGAMLSPRTKFDGGIDVTIKGLNLIPNFSSRVDADAIVSANFGGVTTLVPVTFNQIYNLNLPGSARVYVGGGLGLYFGDKTRFGGKLIAGAEWSRLGLEGNVHFSGSGAALFTVQARIGL